MTCWCGSSLDGSLCAHCGRFFVDCDCKDPDQEHDESRLTEHEVQVLLTFAEQGTIPLAAKALGLAQQTVKNELLLIRRKLGVKSTIQALWKVLGEEQAA